MRQKKDEGKLGPGRAWLQAKTESGKVPVVEEIRGGDRWAEITNRPRGSEAKSHRGESLVVGKSSVIVRNTKEKETKKG